MAKCGFPTSARLGCFGSCVRASRARALARPPADGPSWRVTGRYLRRRVSPSRGPRLLGTQPGSAPFALRLRRVRPDQHHPACNPGSPAHDRGCGGIEINLDPVYVVRGTTPFISGVPATKKPSTQPGSGSSTSTRAARCLTPTSTVGPAPPNYPRDPLLWYNRSRARRRPVGVAASPPPAVSR
jgi:hypothetical protein